MSLSYLPRVLESTCRFCGRKVYSRKGNAVCLNEEDGSMCQQLQVERLAQEVAELKAQIVKITNLLEPKEKTNG